MRRINVVVKSFRSVYWVFVVVVVVGFFLGGEGASHFSACICLQDRYTWCYYS